MPSVRCLALIRFAVLPGSAFPGLGLLFLGACSTPFPLTTVETDPAFRTQLEQQAVALPSAARLQYRAVLAMNGMEIPLDTRILRRAPGDLRVMGLSDLGGTAFHFVSSGDPVGTRILQANPEIAPKVLTDGLARDFAMCFFPTPRPSDQLVRHPSGVGILRCAGTSRMLLWRAGDTGPIDRVSRGSDGHLDAEARIEWQDQRPSYVRGENHQFGYVLELWSPDSQPAWRAAPLTDAHFR